MDNVVVTLTSNLETTTEHGKRADGIVKAVLEHSRGASGERRTVDINGLADAAPHLAYHGARSVSEFQYHSGTGFGEGIAAIELNPRDITRVFLNIFSNGFHAANKRARNGADSNFKPTLKITTRGIDDAVELRMLDNGTGIPPDIRDRLFQPFFTTWKPNIGRPIHHRRLRAQYGRSELAVITSKADIHPGGRHACLRGPQTQ